MARSQIQIQFGQNLDQILFIEISEIIQRSLSKNKNLKKWIFSINFLHAKIIWFSVRVYSFFKLHFLNLSFNFHRAVTTQQEEACGACSVGCPGNLCFGRQSVQDLLPPPRRAGCQLRCLLLIEEEGHMRKYSIWTKKLERRCLI